MIITFYQVAKLFINNSAYLGELIALKSKEINTNLNSISSIDLLLDYEYQNYNYIKVERTEADYFYYYLDTQVYYNFEKTNFKYKIDILRTMKEREGLNHNVNVRRYSNALDMSDDQKNYFWKNQSIKLGASIIESYPEAHIPYCKHIPDELPDHAWSKQKWVYIWLQPRELVTQRLGGTDYPVQYRFTKQIKEPVITVPHAHDLPLNETIYEDNPLWEIYHQGEVWYATDTARYYRVIKDWVFLEEGNVPDYKTLEPLSDFEYTRTEYFLHSIPSVRIKNSSNSLYCMVLPLTEITVIRELIVEGLPTSKSLSWSADNVLPYLFDVESDNNWNDYIVDIKMSLIPPMALDHDHSIFGIEKTNTAYPKLTITIPRTVAGDDFSALENLAQNTIRSEDQTTTVPSNVFLPFLKNKPIEILRLCGDIKLPEITKENVIQKKFYLSLVEERKEIDIVVLKAAKATTLFYYEDLFPGRTNVVYGFAPEYNEVRRVLYFLLHSPSTIFFDRDTSLPVFTTNYQSYVASNKNFMQQAQLQRKSDLTQSLISSGASSLGAASVGSSLQGYNPNAALINSAGKAVNAGITYAVQLKQFNWSVENMKAAPGNYKAASATLAFMLSLDIYNVWMEIYKSSDFDVKIYEELINDVGYEYFDYSYNLKEIIQNTFTGKDPKKFLQAALTGLTTGVKHQLAVINILHQKLQEGVNIFL